MAVYIEGQKLCRVPNTRTRTPFAVETARAFTVKPAWGWLIMKGIKDVENRSVTVLPPKGVCVVSFSKSYTEDEHFDIIESIEDDAVFRKIPEFLELKKLCGKAVGVVNYDVQEESDSPWYCDGCIPWKLSRPRWFKRPFAVTGFVGMWRMKAADARKAIPQIRT